MDEQEPSSPNRLELVTEQNEEAQQIQEDEDSLYDELFSIEAITKRCKQYRVLSNLLDTGLAEVEVRLGPPPPNPRELDPDVDRHTRHDAEFAYIAYSFDKLSAEDKVITKVTGMLFKMWDRSGTTTEISETEPLTNDQIPSTSHAVSHLPKGPVAYPPETPDCKPLTSRADSHMSVALTPRPRVNRRRAAINATFSISRIFNGPRGKKTKQSGDAIERKRRSLPVRRSSRMPSSPGEPRSRSLRRSLRKRTNPGKAAAINATSTISRIFIKSRGKKTKQSGGAIDRKRRSPRIHSSPQEPRSLRKQTDLRKAKPE